MSEARAAERAEAVRDRYRSVFGAVPAGIEDRIAVADAAGRLEAVETIEALRRVLLAENPLGARTQQLVHFAQLVALGREDPARLHARGALRAGASITDLVGVAETSLVTAGMPAYGLAVEIVADLISAESGGGSQALPTEAAPDPAAPSSPREDREVMTVRSISPAEAWTESQRSGQPILDLRTRAERRRYGQPPGSKKVSLLRHALIPHRDAIYLCQHAVRSKVPAARGGREIAGGFVAWRDDHQPIEGGP